MTTNYKCKECKAIKPQHECIDYHDTLDGKLRRMCPTCRADMDLSYSLDDSDYCDTCGDLAPLKLVNGDRMCQGCLDDVENMKRMEQGEKTFPWFDIVVVVASVLIFVFFMQHAFGSEVLPTGVFK